MNYKADKIKELDTMDLRLSDNYNQYHNIETSNKFKLSISTTKGLIILDIKDIIYCEASSNYTIFHLKNSEKYIVSKTLKNYEELLTSFNFIRIHHSFLINLSEVKRFFKKECSSVVMSNGISLTVSKRKRDTFISNLSFYTINKN